MDTTTQGQDPAPGQDPNPTQEVKTFDAEYVKQLRAEAAENRIKAQQAAQELERIKAAEAERERQEAEKRGEFERLYQETSSKLSSVETELEELRTFRATVAERHEQERQALLAKLPDDVRPAFENGTAEQIRVVIDKLSAPQTSPAANRQPARAPETPPATVRPGDPNWLGAYLNTAT